MKPNNPTTPSSSKASGSHLRVDPFSMGAEAARKEAERRASEFNFDDNDLPGYRRRVRSRTKRVAILRSAARAFSRRGYHGTSMDDIAAELLMTKGALYYYFQDKEDILFACHDYSLDQVLENLLTVESSDGPPAEKLRALIFAHVMVMLDALQGSAMALDFNALGPETYPKIVAKRDRFERGMRKLIRDGIEDGSFQETDERLAAFMILGSINWITKWYREGGEYDGQAIADYFADHFIRGLESRPESLEAAMASAPDRKLGKKKA
jgi:TetR/AcrR family transcriptional regulator